MDHLALGVSMCDSRVQPFEPEIQFPVEQVMKHGSGTLTWLLEN
jgi:hypothetical protein